VLQAAAQELGQLSGVVEASVHVGAPPGSRSARSEDMQTEEGNDA
jgi:hypothetical protein